MPRTVPDEEYAFLQGRRQIADFVESIYQDPTLTKEAQALIKKKYPNLAIPDFDLENKVEQRLNAEKKEREDREAEARKSQERERFQNVRGETQKKYGFTDKAMEELEQFMVDHNVGDYEVAAGYKASKEPRPSDVTHSDGRWNHDKAPGFQEIAKDPEGWARDEILKSLYSDEERRKQQRF
jgi:hypothetical protein